MTVMANPRKVLEYLGLFLDRRRADFRYQSGICLKGTQVVGPQQPAISGGSEADRLDAVIAVMEAHGLIATPPVAVPEPEVVEETPDVIIGTVPNVTLGKAPSESETKPLVVKEKKRTYKRRSKK